MVWKGEAFTVLEIAPNRVVTLELHFAAHNVSRYTVWCVVLYRVAVFRVPYSNEPYSAVSNRDVSYAVIHCAVLDCSVLHRIEL